MVRKDNKGGKVTIIVEMIKINIYKVQIQGNT